MEQCEFPKCRCYAELRYIGRNICNAHWEQLCEADCKTEKRLLKKINLVRNESGAVVPITDTEKN
jgi:hypothetical protein